MAELGTRCTYRKGAGRKLSAYGCARRISTRRAGHMSIGGTRELGRALWLLDNLMIGEAFPADLLRTAAFADGVDQLDPIRVDDAEHRRRGQEALRPVLMGHEEAKEPGALGEPWEQRPIVA